MTNDKLATSIRSLHFEATGQMVSDEGIIGYYKNLQDKLVEALCYADDCDWALNKWLDWAETQGIDARNIMKGH